MLGPIHYSNSFFDCFHFYSHFLPLCWLCVNMFIGFCLLLFIQFIVLDFIRIVGVHSKDEEENIQWMPKNGWNAAKKCTPYELLESINMNILVSSYVLSRFFSLKRTQIYERKSASGKCQRGIQEERSKLWSNRAIKNWMSVKIKCTVSQKQQQQNARNENNWNCQVSLDFVLCTFLCSVNVLRSIASLAFSIFVSIWSKFASHSLKEKNC